MKLLLIIILSSILVCFMVARCSEQKDKSTNKPDVDKSQRVSNNLMREDRWEGNVHYVLFFSRYEGQIVAVNYTEDSTEEAMNRKYFSDIVSIDTLGLVSIKPTMNSKKLVLNKRHTQQGDSFYFQPILNHSELTSPDKIIY